MKKILFSFVLLTIIATGCRYKEGPMISFRSVEGRLYRTWQMTEFTSDGIDSLQYYNDSCGAKIRFWKDGDIKSNMNFEEGKIAFCGTIHFLDHKNILLVYFVGAPVGFWSLGPIGGGRKSNWEILKLTKKELKISTDFNGRNYKISFKSYKT